MNTFHFIVYGDDKHPFHPSSTADDGCCIAPQLCNTSPNPTAMKPGALKSSPLLATIDPFRHSSLCSLLTVVFVVSSICCVSVFAESDFVYQSEFEVEAGLTDRLSAEFGTVFVFNDDANKHDETEIEIGLNYEVSNRLEMGAGYLQKYSSSDDGWEDENRPFVNASVKWKWVDWEWSNRAKLEYRMKQDQDAYFRLKNKLEVKSPWKWTKLEINPYAADQIYIDEEDDFYKNKTNLGVGMKFSEHVYGDIHYYLEVEKDDGDWDQYVHAIVTKLELKF